MGHLAMVELLGVAIILEARSPKPFFILVCLLSRSLPEL